MTVVCVRVCLIPEGLDYRLVDIIILYCRVLVLYGVGDLPGWVMNGWEFGWEKMALYSFYFIL